MQKLDYALSSQLEGWVGSTQSCLVWVLCLQLHLTSDGALPRIFGRFTANEHAPVKESCDFPFWSPLVLKVLHLECYISFLQLSIQKLPLCANNVFSESHCVLSACVVATPSANSLILLWAPPSSDITSISYSSPAHSREPAFSLQQGFLLSLVTQLAHATTPKVMATFSQPGRRLKWRITFPICHWAFSKGHAWHNLHDLGTYTKPSYTTKRRDW